MDLLAGVLRLLWATLSLAVWLATLVITIVIAIVTLLWRLAAWTHGRLAPAGPELPGIEAAKERP